MSDIEIVLYGIFIKMTWLWIPIIFTIIATYLCEKIERIHTEKKKQLATNLKMSKLPSLKAFKNNAA